MSFSNHNSMKVTIQQLKDIVTSIQGEDHETAKLITQMEAVVSEIERKGGRIAQSAAPPTIAATAPATA